MTDEPRVLLEDFEIYEPVEEADAWTDFKPLEIVTSVDDNEPLDLANIAHCPRCNKPLVKAVAISGNESETWRECPECGTLVNTFRPIDYQAAFLSNPKRYKLTSGGFGCTHPDMHILMYDGSKKKAKDIQLGELLMGPDNTPRKVLEIHKGNDTRYRINLKGVAEPLEFNGGHILYLFNRDWTGIHKRGQHNYLGQYMTMPIENYIHTSKRFKNSHYWLFTQGFEYDYKPVPIEPYLLGLLLGDGYIGRSVSLTTNDEELIRVCKIYEDIYNVKVVVQSKKGDTKTVGFITRNKNEGTQGYPKNNLLEALRDLNLSGALSQTKFIPDVYKHNSKDVRRKILAGIIDTDGHQHCNTIYITLAGEQLARDIKDVAQSLGIRARLTTRKVKGYPDNIYYRVTLSGAELNNLPMILERKKVNATPNKRQHTQRFTIEKVSDNAPYVGFTVDKDHLYVEAENYSIIHNSGKSRTNIEDVMKHLIVIPNARVCVVARTYPALEATFVKEFYAMFPAKLVRSKNDQKHEVYFTNGSQLIFRSFDDPTKLKSMNLTMAVIIEGSDCPYSGFTMLQSRIRNTAALIPEYDLNGNVVTYWDERTQQTRIKYRVDARRINIETNPDSGWVKSFLLDSSEVQFFGSAKNEGYRFNKEPDIHKYTQVVSTDANPHLPEGYEEEQSKGKPISYIMQMFKGSFNFSDNLVFPNVGAVIVPPKELPAAFDAYGNRTLYYAIGLDYGINDPTHVVFAAYSTVHKKLYVFDELRMNNSDVKTIATAYRKQIRMNGTDLRGLLMMPRFDGRSYNKRESDLYTIGGAFEAQGLFFEPSFTGHEARILKLNALINHDQIEIFSTCEFLIEELLVYKFKVDRNGKVTNKPVDGRDHGITALEFIVVELPHNLKELKLSAFIPVGKEFKHDTTFIAKRPQNKIQYNPLEETENERNTSIYHNNLVVNARSSANVVSSIDYVVDDETTENDEDDYERDGGDHVYRSYIPGKPF
jgi:hypothetical protein